VYIDQRLTTHVFQMRPSHHFTASLGDSIIYLVILAA